MKQILYAKWPKDDLRRVYEMFRPALLKYPRRYQSVEMSEDGATVTVTLAHGTRIVYTALTKEEYQRRGESLISPEVRGVGSEGKVEMVVRGRHVRSLF